jgi:peptidoglycan hydrolase-like protein with peptidoglycan-binding domain
MINKIGLIALSTVLVAAPLFAYADVLNRQLEVGSSGSDVSALQTFLASDPTLYPQGLVTGYFGFLTKAAVSNFQSRNGISAVGRVGPVTLPILNAQINAGVITTYTDAPIISAVAVNMDNNSAVINWHTNELAMGVVYYSTEQIAASESGNTVTISGTPVMTDTVARLSQSVSLKNLHPNTRYFFMISSTDVDGNVSVTLQSTFQTGN